MNMQVSKFKLLQERIKDVEREQQFVTELKAALDEQSAGGKTITGVEAQELVDLAKPLPKDFLKDLKENVQYALTADDHWKCDATARKTFADFLGVGVDTLPEAAPLTAAQAAEKTEKAAEILDEVHKLAPEYSAVLKQLLANKESGLPTDTYDGSKGGVLDLLQKSLPAKEAKELCPYSPETIARLDETYGAGTAQTMMQVELSMINAEIATLMATQGHSVEEISAVLGDDPQALEMAKTAHLYKDALGDTEYDFADHQKALKETREQFLDYAQTLSGNEDHPRFEDLVKEELDLDKRVFSDLATKATAETKDPSPSLKMLMKSYERLLGDLKENADAVIEAAKAEKAETPSPLTEQQEMLLLLLICALLEEGVSPSEIDEMLANALGSTGGYGGASGGYEGANPVRNGRGSGRFSQNGGASASSYKPTQWNPVTDPAPAGFGVSVGELKQIVPGLSGAKAESINGHLNKAMHEAGITDPTEQAAFIAQLAHESGGFKYMEEIASGSAYEGRSDLGNTQPGDGKRFKGRGPIQLTGRANYKAAGKALGLDLVNNPELAAKPENGFRISAWYWKTRGCDKAARQGDFRAVTKKINGGYNGLASRQNYYQKALMAVG